MATQAIKSALPAHLKPGNNDEAEFAKRHHGKTRSHMVSSSQILILVPFSSSSYL